MEPLSVDGKYAIITGGGSGINLAFARILLRNGCSVLIGDLNLRPESQELLAQYPHPPPSTLNEPSAIFHPTDVRSWPQLSALFEKGLAAFPRIDIVCPGAGLFEPSWSHFWNAPKSASNPDSTSRDPVSSEVGTYTTLDVNLTHPIRLSQLALGYWTREHIPGNLVHVSSTASLGASVFLPLYFASKHGLNGFVRSLGSLRDEMGIRVSAVAPAAVMTPLWTDNPEKMALLRTQDNMLEPETIAQAMLDLCTDPEYGDGTILEVFVGGRRVVPLYNADPPVRHGGRLEGYVDAQKELVRSVKEHGFRT